MEQKIVMYQTQVKKKTSSELFVFAENILWEFKEESQKNEGFVNCSPKATKITFPKHLTNYEI